MNDILLIILIAYTLSTPFVYHKAIQYGVKLATKPEKTAEEPVFHVPLPKKKPKLTPQEDRILQIIANIDKYNGDSKGQKKVEIKNG